MSTRSVLLLALLVLAQVCAAGDTKKPGRLAPYTMEVGQVGELPPANEVTPGAGGVEHSFAYRIQRVSKDAAEIRVIVTVWRKGQPDDQPASYFLVRGINTDSLIDGRAWKPTGTWKVTRTEKVGTRTLAVIEPHPGDGKKK